MAKILLLGLDQDVAQKIESASLQVNHSVAIQPLLQAFDTYPDADLVFVSGDRKNYRETVRSIQERRNKLPVVVVTSRADSAEWIDALEAGAANYCSAPFEAKPIQWILASALQPFSTSASDRPLSDGSNSRARAACI
jgi:DNA-binding NtrC family response regulator